MNFVLMVLIAVQLLSALAMIGLILVQQGKGADAGAAFGGGGAGSATLFGASGGANFMSRSTAVLTTVFLLSTLALAYFGNAEPVAGGASVLENLPAAEVPAPASTQIPDASPVAPPVGAASIPGQ